MLFGKTQEFGDPSIGQFFWWGLRVLFIRTLNFWLYQKSICFAWIDLPRRCSTAEQNQNESNGRAKQSVATRVEVLTKTYHRITF